MKVLFSGFPLHHHPAWFDADKTTLYNSTLILTLGVNFGVLLCSTVTSNLRCTSKKKNRIYYYAQFPNTSLCKFPSFFTCCQCRFYMGNTCNFCRLKKVNAVRSSLLYCCSTSIGTDLAKTSVIHFAKI